jgi:hypothetical protein
MQRTETRGSEQFGYNYDRMTVTNLLSYITKRIFLSLPVK